VAATGARLSLRLLAVNLFDVTQLSQAQGKGDDAYARATTYHGDLTVDWLDT
jgi:hypothetical protein